MVTGHEQVCRKISRFGEATRKVLSFGGRFQQWNPLGLGERKVPNKVAGRFRKVLVRVDNRRNAPNRLLSILGISHKCIQLK